MFVYVNENYPTTRPAGKTCARLCHVNGAELEQIQFLLGYASVLTKERYLGCKQKSRETSE
jgi:hypothetical protein